MNTLMTGADTTPTGSQPGATTTATPEGTAPAAPAGEAPNQQPGTNTPAEGAKPTEGEGAASTEEGKAGEGEKPTTGAPEAYEDFKVPEGVALDTEVTTEFKTLAKELDLSQENAQKLTDLATKLSAKHQGQMADVLKQAAADWTQAAQTDKEFGGEKLNENLSVAKKARDTFGTPELTQLLDESGLGNHPEVIRFFYRTGKAISEDGFVPGTKQVPVKSTAQRLFPGMNP